MHKKDYELIAKAIKLAFDDCNTIQEKRTIEKVVDQMIYALEEENEAFNRVKFLEATRPNPLKTKA